jgi:NADPH:quinone reductase
VKVVGVETFGGPEVLGVFEVPDPHPGPGEIRIRVRAATVNPADIGLRAGAFGASLTSPSPHVPGMDAAGFVDEVGDGVHWQVGDEVMAVVMPIGPHGGAYAERVVVPADSVAPIPAGVDFVAASTLPMNGLTARASLDQLALPPGATLGVTGAAGCYGGYVIQLAKAEGLRVIADASPTDRDLVRSLGADVVVPRGDDVAAVIRAEVPDGVDGLADGAVLDAAVLPAIRDGGGLAVVRRWRGPTERGIALHKTSVGEYAHNQVALDQLRQAVEAGQVTLRVAATFPPEDAPRAHRRLEAGGTRGRLVIVF